ncbi:MAG TPA: biopolymer transporter ExbD [Gemmatimonadales bacterium]|jgi:biopolymer transport protein ExbD|nr:biopolymer transporter ExbD [Gemmatimonadales bacterium]
MGMSTGGGGGMSAEPNVVPMIDILLVLLIIFMVSQPLNRKSMNIQVAPPDTRTTSQAANNQIVLELPDAGGYLINTQPVPDGQLGQQLHTIFDPRPAKLLFVKAGQGRQYKDVINAMDIAYGAGIQIIGFTPIEAYR